MFNKGLEFILESRGFQDKLTVWDISSNLQNELLKLIAPAPTWVVGVIWTIETSKKVEQILNLCVELKKVTWELATSEID